MRLSLGTFFVGVLFALGLGLGGMTQPIKVVGFLDVFGNWDPSLLFVMVGAVGTHFVLYRLIRKRTTPLLTHEWHIPQKTELSRDLIVGSFIFGVGWALAGYCPGPAMTSLATLKIKTLLFVVSMLAGMFLFGLYDKARLRRASSKKSRQLLRSPS